MSARGQLHLLIGVALSTVLLSILALVSPLLAGPLITGERRTGRDDLLVCLFVPTGADWPAHVLSYLLAGLLALSTLSGLTSFLRMLFRTRRALRVLLRLAPRMESRRLELSLASKELSGLQGRVDLVQTERPLAFCYGWLRPRICLSTGAVEQLKRKELEALLLHEYHHLLHRDPLKTTLAHVLSSSLFFMPVARSLRRQFLLAKEIEADEYALHVQGSANPLLGALYKLLLRQGGLTKGGSIAAAGAVDCINQRLDYLLDKRPPAGTPLLSIIVSSSIIAGITSVMAFSAWAAAASTVWQQAHSSLGGC